MRNKNQIRIASLLAIVLLNSTLAKAQDKEAAVETLYNFEVTTITGDSVMLSDYQGKVLLIVNTASKCGFTGQYEGLEKLYQTYKDQGLVILGFPSNNFLNQEPGTNEEILEFCQLNYGVTFPMFEKIDVKGNSQHPLYAYLTSEVTDPEFGGKISWNFNKFLISRDGQIIGRFGSRTKPQDDEMVAAIEAALAR